MSSFNLPDIPSFRKQHLLLEFASLKLRCPEGIYLSLSPGDHTFWSGVFFVRTGPYSPAVLRFSISFPAQFPDRAPLVTFATDVFHPLLVPLTTYTFSTSASDANETVSASDEERLPPGGFSLRNGFPRWFGRQERAARGMMDPAGDRNGSDKRSREGLRDISADAASTSPMENQVSPSSSTQESDARPVAISEVLAYIKSTFEDPSILDRLSLKAAGNSGAWYAWRSYRGFSKNTSRAISPAHDDRSNSPASGSHALPSDWNWEGVWENRVQSGIENSLSDPVLFAPKGGRVGEKRTEVIRFSKIDDEQLKEIREKAIGIQSTGSKT